jgi:Zn-dependent membrane protease YugP
MPFFFYDPVSFVVLLPAFVLAIYAQWKVSSTFRRYSEIRSSTGYTGAQVAAELLRRNGITNVKVEPIEGMLSDHYDPRQKVLRLSPEVYGSDSIAAIAAAAHEAGHALQDKQRYPALALRAAIVPLASFGTSAAWILFIIGLITSSPRLMDLGILIFLGYVAFAIITLPVEFNASSRAVAQLTGQGLVLPQEAQGVRAVLNAAALTYVAAAAMAVLQLVRLILLRSSRD